MVDMPLIDYADPDAVARQNVHPNAGCEIDGQFIDVRNLMHIIAELKAEVERLTKERDDALMVKREAVAGWRDAEALSRTGAVKVDRQRLNMEISKWATDSDLHITIGDVEALHKAILSALEPAAPEGEQEVEPVAFRVHDFHVARMPVKAKGKFPEPTEFLYPASRAQDAKETARIMGGECQPLFTRPSEQAVTEAGERAAEQVMTAHYERPLKAWELTALHAALKAAMEAGRHE